MKKLFLPAVLAACALPSWAADPEWVLGRIVGLDLPRSKVTLEHAPIRSVKMDAMTMPFKVKDAGLLTPLKVGDKVRFEVQEREGELVVLRIEPQR